MVKLLPWSSKDAPTEKAMRKIFKEEGLRPYRWQNDPGDAYAPHSHTYYKIIYVIEGSMTLAFPEEDHPVKVRAGDRIEIPPGVVHQADIGPQGIVCLEGHRRI